MTARPPSTGQNDGMSPQPGGNGGDVARSAGSAALKGALLIGLAVIIGIFLLQRVDNNKSSAAPTTTPRATTTTTVTRPTASSTSPSTSQPSGPVKTPAELKVIVLNGGGR